MRQFFISLLVIGSLFSLTVSLTAMNRMDEQGHVKCPLETAGVIDCAQTQNLVDSMSAHVNAFAQFFLATSVDGFALFLALFSLFVLAALASFANDLTLPALVPVRTGNRSRVSVAQRSVQFADWLSLHENSPVFIARRTVSNRL